MTEPSSTEPEIWYFIGLHGNAHGTAKLTSRDDDGRIVRDDGRGPWEPLFGDDGHPLWFRVSQEVADEWTADDDDEDDDDWIGRP